MYMRDPEKLYMHDKLIRPFTWLIPSFVKPNHLSIFRLLITPLVVVLLVMQRYDIGVPLFFFVASTDALDGSLSRLRKQVTDAGAILDPLADKILVGSVIIFVIFPYLPLWLAVLVIAIELLLLTGGWRKKKQGKRVRRANIWGKVKMVLQTLATLLGLIALWAMAPGLFSIVTMLFVIALILAVISLFTYSI